MSYTKVNTQSMKDKILNIDFVKSIEYIGGIELRGSSNSDIDFLLELEMIPDYLNKTDEEINEYVKAKLDEVISIIGEKPGTCSGHCYIDSGIIEWVIYHSKIPDKTIIIRASFINLDNIPIDLFWVMGKTAVEGTNHDYWADKVTWRIEETSKGE